MPKPRFRDRHIVTNRPPGPEEGVHRDRPEGDDHAQGGEESHLALEIRLAVAELRRRGSVSRWSTSHRGSYVAIAQPEAVGLRDGGGLIRESVPVEGAKQPVAAPISREDAASPIASVGRRGKADDEEPGARISEAGDGPPPVLPIPERGPLRSGDLLAVSYQAGAAAAANDLGRDAFQGIATAYHRPFRRFTHNRRLPQSIEN